MYDNSLVHFWPWRSNHPNSFILDLSILSPATPNGTHRPIFDKHGPTEYICTLGRSDCRCGHRMGLLVVSSGIPPTARKAPCYVLHARISYTVRVKWFPAQHVRSTFAIGQIAASLSIVPTTSSVTRLTMSRGTLLAHDVVPTSSDRIF